MKITYLNEQNGLSAEFSTTTPMMFMEKFNGNSVGADAVTYRPADYDGQRFISANINPRTVQLTVNFGGKLDGRYSRAEALKRWEEIQRVFVPGIYGVLTLSDGENSRFIRCRTSALPNPSEILPFLFRAEIEFIADLPLWFDGEENAVQLTSGTTTINNPCGITAPFLVEVPAGTTAVLLNTTSGKVLKMLNNLSEAYTIDTSACTVTTGSGALVNNQLSVDSEFWGLVPGDNVIVASGISGAVLRWRRVYLGVGG